MTQALKTVTDHLNDAQAMLSDPQATPMQDSTRIALASAHIAKALDAIQFARAEAIASLDKFAIALLVLSPLLFSTPAAAIDCRASAGAGSHWSWRQVDGRRCWYQGRGRVSKNRLRWPVPKSRPVTTPAPELLEASEEAPPPAPPPIDTAAALAAAGRARLAAQADAPMVPTLVQTVAIEPLQAAEPCPAPPAPAAPATAPEASRGRVVAALVGGALFGVALTLTCFPRRRTVAWGS